MARTRKLKVLPTSPVVTIANKTNTNKKRTRKKKNNSSLLID
jgi:hypothetical protein